MTDYRYIDYELPEELGIRFRHYAGDEDLPGIVEVFNKCKEIDGMDGTLTSEELGQSWSRLQNCDLSEDVLIVEQNNKIVGFGRHDWICEPSGLYRYWLATQIVPELREHGIREKMLAYLEKCIVNQSKSHPGNDKFFEIHLGDTETHAINLYDSQGYEIVRYGAEMIRPDLENIPELELPENVELRPAKPEHYKQIFMTHIDAFRESWGFYDVDWDKAYEGFKGSKVFQPELWQIAWHGDEVVSQVKPFILQDENKEYNRKRGYVEFISTAKAWRGKGLASALIARGLKRVKEEGMEEAALGVDTENIHGAMRLYEKMGFRKHRLGMTYRKPLP